MTQISLDATSKCEGQPTREIFEALPTFQKTSSSADSVEVEFEKFMDFVDSVLRSFAQWTRSKALVPMRQSYLSGGR